MLLFGVYFVLVLIESLSRVLQLLYLYSVSEEVLNLDLIFHPVDRVSTGAFLFLVELLVVLPHSLQS